MDFRKYLVVFLILFLIGAIFGLFGTAINNMQKISEPENTGNPEELLYLSNNVTLERETYEFFGCLSGVNVVSGDILECIRGGNYSGTENKYLQVKYLKDECGGYGTVVETCDEGKVCIEVPFQYNGLLIRDYTLMNGTNFRYRVECIDPPQDIGEIKNLIHNGDLDEKLNLLVVNIDFDEEAFLEIMNVTLFGDSPYSEYDVGFFELSPFYENQNKFNVDYVSEIPVDFLECMGDGTEGRGFHIFSSFQCNIDRLRNLYSDYDFIAVFGKYIKTHAMENSIYISNKSNSVSLGQAFSHEFAHMFGLVEEYQYYTELYCPTGEPPCFTVVSVFDFDTSSSGFAAVPNLDKVGCPKWCEDFDLNLLLEDETVIWCRDATNKNDCFMKSGGGTCTWSDTIIYPFESHCIPEYSIVNMGINCKEDSGCYMGGNVAPHSYIASYANIMRMFGQNAIFDYPSREHLSKVLNCCFPKTETAECVDFRNQFNIDPYETGTVPGFNLPNIVNCSFN